MLDIAPILRRLIVIACCASMCACTSMQLAPLPGQADGKSSSKPLAVGDSAYLVLKSGEKVWLVVSQAEANTIKGRNSDSPQELSFSVDQIASVERRELDGMRTLLLIGGLVVFTALWAHAVGKQITSGAP